MLHRAPFRIALCACVAFALALAAFSDSARQDARSLSPAEIRALVDRAITNQHHNDEALTLYERRERRQTRKNESDTNFSEDKLFRVVPHGTGVYRLVLEESGRPAPTNQYRKQLSELERELIAALDPVDSKQKRSIEKFAKRSKERAEFLEAIRNAFLFTWQGRETSSGRSLVRLLLEPNPNFDPHSRSTEMLHHARAIVWIDEAAAQLVRVEAEIATDISFGGGILGKVYRGGRFVFTQTQVAEGVWLPVRYEYNMTGRKFLFGFELHEVTVATAYRRIGPPKEALAAIRHELSTASSAPASH